MNSTKRPDVDEYIMNLLPHVASRSTCARRAVGAIITDDKGHIIATGYNGVPSEMPHCIDSPCPGAADQSGDNSRCLAIHAETNAVLQAGDRVRFATRIYCSCTPCFNCAKTILSTGIKDIVALQLYSDTSGVDLLKAAGRRVWRPATTKEAGVSAEHPLLVRV